MGEASRDARNRRAAIIFSATLIALSILGAAATYFMLRIQTQVATIARLANEQFEVWSGIGRILELAPTVIENGSDKPHLAAQIRTAIREKMQRSQEVSEELVAIFDRPSAFYFLFSGVSDHQYVERLAESDSHLWRQILDYSQYPDHLIALGISTWDSDLQISVQTGSYLTRYKRLVTASNEIIGRAVYRTTIAVVLINSIMLGSSLLIWFRILAPTFRDLRRSRFGLRVANRRLDQRFALFSAAFFAIRDAACIFTGEGDIVVANPAFLKLFSAQFANPSKRDGNIFEVLEKYDHAGREALVEHSPDQWDGTIIRLDDRQTVVIRMAAAGPDHWIMMAIDKNEIAGLVSEQEHVDRLTQIGAFAGGVAHDFNNALGAMLGRIQLVRRSSTLDAEAARHFEALEEVVKRSAGFVSQLLIYAGKRNLTPVTVRTCSLVALLEQDLMVPAHIELKITCTTDRIIAVDLLFLSSAVANLVSNSAAAIGAEPDAIHVTIHEAALKGEGPYEARVAINVQDTGGGFSRVALQRAREPFFSTRREQHGTGLGLSIVERFVQQSYGDMTIENTPEGASVTLYFPSPSDELPEVESDEAAGIDQQAVHARCMVLEDNLPLSEMLTDYLSMIGVDVIHAGDLKTARQVTNKFDYALCDWRLPDGEAGTYLATLLKSIPKSRIAIVTGHADGQAKKFAADHNIHLFQKPVSLEQIREFLSA